MRIIKSTSFWAIVSIIIGLLLFTYGCVGAGDTTQYAGAFFIAIGIFTADFAISGKKVMKE